MTVDGRQGTLTVLIDADWVILSIYMIMMSHDHSKERQLGLYFSNAKLKLAFISRSHAA